MRYFHLPVLIFIFFLACATSCKKSSSATGVNVNNEFKYKIATVHYVGNLGIQDYRFVYNAQGQVDSIFGPVGITIFSYTPTVINVTIDSTSGGIYRYNMYTNANGSVTQINAPDTTFLSYNSENELNTYKVLYAGGGTEIDRYTWINGEIDSVVYSNGYPSENTSRRYFYNLGYFSQPGDPLSISDFITYGRTIIRSQHLMIGSSNSLDLNIAYKFDTLHRITQLTMSGDLVIATFSYTYTTN